MESVLAILPLIAMLIIFGAFDGMTQRGEWQTFFGIFGGLVSLVGLAGFFLIPETKVERKRTPFFRKPAVRLQARGGALAAQPLSVAVRDVRVLHRRAGVLPLPDHLHAAFSHDG